MREILLQNTIIYALFALLLSAAFISYLSRGFFRVEILRRGYERGYQARLLPRALAIAIVVTAVLTQGFWLGFLLILFAFLLAADTVLLIQRVLRKKRGNQALYTLLPLILSLALCIAGAVNARVIAVTRYSMNIRGLEGLRVVLVSDMHLGAMLTEDDLGGIVERINGLEPDVVALCGDIYEERTTAAQYAVSLEAFADIQAVHGVYYVPGNHEHAAQKNGVIDVAKLERDFGGIGITMLCDESVFVDGRFYIVGRDDADNIGRAELPLLMEGSDGFPVILLDHQPVEQAEAERLGVDLQLSGHTHGGQMLPVPAMADWAGVFEQTYGQRGQEGYSSVVSSGVGTLHMPLRIGTPSEIVLISG